jgi:hypothetical protein
MGAQLAAGQGQRAPPLRNKAVHPRCGFSRGQYTLRDSGVPRASEFKGQYVPRGGGSQRAVSSQEQWALRVIKDLRTKENHTQGERGKSQNNGFPEKWRFSGPRRTC